MKIVFKVSKIQVTLFLIKYLKSQCYEKINFNRGDNLSFTEY